METAMHRSKDNLRVPRPFPLHAETMARSETTASGLSLETMVQCVMSRVWVAQFKALGLRSDLQDLGSLQACSGPMLAKWLLRRPEKSEWHCGHHGSCPRI